MTTNDQHNKETSKKKYIFFSIQSKYALLHKTTHICTNIPRSEWRREHTNVSDWTESCVRKIWFSVVFTVIRRTHECTLTSTLCRERRTRMLRTCLRRAVRRSLVSLFIDARRSLWIWWRVPSTHLRCMMLSLHGTFRYCIFFLQYLQAEDEYWMAIDTNNMWLLWYLFLLCRIDSMNAIVLGSILLFVRAYIACEWKMNESSRKPLCYVHILWCP